MKQGVAQQIIEEAGQHQHLTATLDAAHAGRYKHGDGYRVRLTQRVLMIDKQEQGECRIKQAKYHMQAMSATFFSGCAKRLLPGSMALWVLEKACGDSGRRRPLKWDFRHTLESLFRMISG